MNKNPPFYNDDEAKDMGWKKKNGNIAPTDSAPSNMVGEQIKYLNEKPASLKMFLNEGKNQTIATAVNDARTNANKKLHDLATLNIQGLNLTKQTNGIYIGGKRTKRAKTSNRKTKNNRKKLHKRN